MRVHMGDWLGTHVYLEGEYEPETTSVVRQLLRPGDTVLDVGANVGYYTLLAASLVGPAGKVYAFEPAPCTRQRLIDNIVLNRLTNVHVKAEAITDQQQTLTLFQGPEDHLGLSSLRPLDATSATFEVRADTLDALLPADETVDFVKIDVEGAEGKVLAGMEPILDRCRPDLVIEIVDRYLRAMSSSAESLCSRLCGLGYRMYMISSDGLIPLQAWTSDLPEEFNALFTIKEHLPPAIRIQHRPSARCPAQAAKE